MKENSYGFLEQTEVPDSEARYAEEVAIKGYTVIPNVIAEPALCEMRDRIDRVYAEQERSFGKQALADIHEVDACRAPLIYDFAFAAYASHPAVLAVIRRFLGDWFILNLQNAVINRPQQEHHQSAWHRDLPYQNFVISNPLAINALWVVDEFTAETGGTYVLPFTHKQERVPSDAYIANNAVVVTASAGSVVLFDSMIIHRAGANRSRSIRRALNHLYTTPILKQQYDFPRALAALRDAIDPNLQRLLGFTSQVPLDDVEWRRTRAARLQRPAQ